MAAATIANMTTLLLACDAMFKGHMPSGVQVMSFEVKDGKIMNWFHDEDRILKSLIVDIPKEFKPVDLSLQVLQEGSIILVGGDVKMSDEQHCAVKGHNKKLRLAETTIEGVCRLDTRNVRLDRHIYAFKPDVDWPWARFDLFYSNPVGSIIRTVNYMEHIGIEGKKAEFFVFEKDGKCQRVETAKFKDGWPLGECDTTPIELKSGNKTTTSQLYSLRYLLTVFDCNANGTSNLSPNFIDNTYVKFLLDPIKDEEAKEEKGMNQWLIIGPSIGCGVLFVILVVGVVFVLKNKKNKKEMVGKDEGQGN